MDDPVEVLEFWLGTVGPKGWYAGGEELDAMCRDQCLDLWQAAKDGGLDHWVDGTVGTLAFLILTDQLPRNMFRGQADSFRTDPLALSAARRALDALAFQQLVHARLKVPRAREQCNNANRKRLRRLQIPGARIRVDAAANLQIGQPRVAKDVQVIAALSYVAFRIPERVFNALRVVLQL